MIGVQRCRSGPGLFRLSPDYTSCFALLTEESPKSSHGHFRLVHFICVCSCNSGYLLLLFRPIYLFYVAVGGKLLIRKHAHVCFCSCSCINKEMIQSFTWLKWGWQNTVSTPDASGMTRRVRCRHGASLLLFRRCPPLLFFTRHLYLSVDAQLG